MDAPRRFAGPTRGPGLFDETLTLRSNVCAWLVTGLAIVAAGCSAAASEPGPSLEATGGSPTSPPSMVEDTVDVRLELEETSPLVAREQRELSVIVSPGGARTVRFALVDARDAALDRSLVVTDTSGRANVWLTAPSSVGSFGVRAHVGSATAEVQLSVSARDRATVEVVPLYEGRRAVSEWVGSVHVGRRCSDFEGIPPESVTFARFGPDQTARLAGVPLGPELAVTVRTGQFARGCTEVAAGASSEKLRVEVPITDLPLALEDTRLEIALGLTPQDPAFSTAIRRGVEAATEAFRDGQANDVAALLDAMEAALPGPTQTEFRAARDANASLDQPAGASGANHLTDTLARWLETGRVALLSTRAFEGTLSPGSARPDRQPNLEIARIGQIEAGELNVAVTMTSWLADASDTLSFAGQVSWNHARLISELARGPATAETGATDIPGAMAVVARCDQLGASLAAGTAGATLAMACSPTCLAAACKTALGTMWERAKTASIGEATLNVAAAGIATVGEQAQATGIEGSWVGKLTLSDDSNETSGDLHGTAPRYTAR
jgi:hypothetical protein